MVERAAPFQNILWKRYVYGGLTTLAIIRPAGCAGASSDVAVVIFWVNTAATVAVRVFGVIFRLDGSDIYLASGDPASLICRHPLSVNGLEWEHSQRVLRDNEGNISATVRQLRMHRRTLQRKRAKRPEKFDG